MVKTFEKEGRDVRHGAYRRAARLATVVQRHREKNDPRAAALLDWAFATLRRSSQPPRSRLTTQRSAPRRRDDGAKVLVADKLTRLALSISSPSADRRPRRDRSPATGSSDVPDYDGLAVRSATKVTEKVVAAADRLKLIGRAGIGVDKSTSPPRRAASSS
jgi:hypothetical protein